MCIILINHMIKNYSTNKGYDNSSVRVDLESRHTELTLLNWQVQRMECDHTDLRALLSSPLPLV